MPKGLSPAAELPLLLSRQVSGNINPHLNFPHLPGTNMAMASDLNTFSTVAQQRGRAAKLILLSVFPILGVNAKNPTAVERVGFREKKPGCIRSIRKQDRVRPRR